MMTAAEYGNAGAYFQNALTSNGGTAFMVGQDTSDGNLTWSRVTYYSCMRDNATSPPTGLTPSQRLTSPGCAIVGRQGMRPVAFPMSDGWNFDQPIVT
jgi:hypothetical protein